MAKKTKRDDELSKKPRIKEHLLKLYRDIEQAFVDQHERSDDIMDFWDCFNCKLGARQFYDGNSKIFVPIVKNAVDARKTRFVNQIFPQSGRYVEVTTSDIDLPEEQMSLAEHYVRTSKLRTEIMPALSVAGDVEGQYSLYLTWEERKKFVARRVDKPFESGGLQFDEIGSSEDMEEEEIVESGPKTEVINDNDIMVIPVTADSIAEAISVGGSVTILRRWTKGQVKKMAADGEITEDAKEILLKEMMSKKDNMSNRDTQKKMADAAGIKGGPGDKYALVYETWTNLKVDGDWRLCRSYFGSESLILGCKLNPYWHDECPLLSAPVAKVAGVFKGRSRIADVIDMQVAANDACNEGADTGHFSAMPIIMTNPEKNPKIGTMVLGLASIWETSPQDTSFAQFPDMTQSTLARIAFAKDEIFQTLSVNPAMIAQNTGTKKRNQAEVAVEQQVDILTTADAVTVLEESILTPWLQMVMALDHQFRDRAVTIKQYGEMGMKANMQEIPPIQMNHRYEYRWFGVEQARNAQQVQQQIAMANVIKGIPPQLLPGYRLNMVPLVTRLCDNSFGHRLAPLVFEKIQGITVDPQMENDLMQQGFDTPTHPEDDDQQHLMAHMQAASTGDFHGHIRSHIMAHQQQMQAKAQAAQAAQNPQGLPGSPGGAGPGAAGAPKPGGQVAGPRLVKGPPGMIAPESMAKAGAVTMPRKF